MGASAVEARWEDVLLGARLADVQDTVCRNTLALAALIELLAARGVITPEELARAARRIDRDPPVAAPVGPRGLP